MNYCNFSRLIGTWQTQGTIFQESGNQTLSGLDSYEYILQEKAILHKANVTMGKEKSETFEIITPGNSAEHAIMNYFNSNGEHGKMQGTISGNEWKIQGEKIKFEGTIDEQSTMITGKWSVQDNDDRWNIFIDMTLRKMNSK